MTNVVDVFDEIAFDIEDFEVPAPQSYKTYGGPHTMWSVTDNSYQAQTYVGYKEHFPVPYACLTRDPRTGLVQDPSLLHDVMAHARSYITLFRATYRVSLMVTGTFGWFKAAAIFAADSRTWRKLLDKTHEHYRLYPQAFNCLDDGMVRETLCLPF